jgi:hypothetical protein
MPPAAERLSLLGGPERRPYRRPMSSLRSKLTYANAAATLALFLAIGGTGYAAAQLPHDSVGATQIRRGAVGSSEVRDGSLLSSDFRTGQLPAGERGPQGVPGPQGERGPAGAGSVTPIPLLDVANMGGGTLADVPGVGRLEARNCANLNDVLHYVNESAAPQRWVLTGNVHARMNLPADTGVVEPGDWIENIHNDATDNLRLSVYGPRPVTYELTQARGPAAHCLFWGHVLAG